jgi:hypothetical protein
MTNLPKLIRDWILLNNLEEQYVETGLAYKLYRSLQDESMVIKVLGVLERHKREGLENIVRC